MNKTALAAVAFAILFLVVVVYLTVGGRRYRVEVCVEFGARTSCRVASSTTREQAQRTATENACSLLASGMTDSMACTATPPKSVRWLSE